MGQTRRLEKEFLVKDRQTRRLEKGDFFRQLKIKQTNLTLRVGSSNKLVQIDFV